MHVRYLRELREGDPVRVTVQLLDYDAKRIHYFETLKHADEGWVSATSENMTLHVDMGAKKVAPFPQSVLDRLAVMKAAHAHLPRAGGRRAPDCNARERLVDAPAGKAAPRHGEEIAHRLATIGAEHAAGRVCDSSQARKIAGPAMSSPEPTRPMGTPLRRPS